MFSITLLVGFVSGFLGSLIGSGGGVFMVPLLTLVVGLPIKVAIGASIVAVIATSVAASLSYLDEGLTNVPLGLFLELSTTVGAILGGLTAMILQKEFLYALFAVVMVPTIFSLLKSAPDDETAAATEYDPALPRRTDLTGRYHDRRLGCDVEYQPRRLSLGMITSFVAGNVSGLLGIGGGVIKVPAMTLLMGVPVKPAVATSNFMIGVTAMASAYVYYSRGYVDPFVAVPTALGVMVGAFIGSHLAPRLRSRQLILLFAVVLSIISIQMGLGAFGVTLR